jgi:DNA-binding response OmpR family regulator
MKKRILIVDDDASVRKALGKVLEDEGYNIMLAADGREALEQFESEPVDLLLLDIGLPIRNGWDTFERITSQAPAFPIIIITGKANQHDMAVAAGVGALIEKPLDVSQLLKTIQELLAESPEARLRRLCGYSRDIRYIPSARPLSGQKLRG